MRVVVTGLGCVTPIGNSVTAFRESMYAGSTGIAEFDRNFPESLSPDPGLKFKTTAKVKDFNPSEHLSTGVISVTDVSAQFGIVAARQAVQETAVLTHYNPAEIAILTGCSCGGRSTDEEGNRQLFTRNARVPPTSIIRNMGSSGASQIAIDCGITGPVLNVNTACASSTHAIGMAFHMVRSGMASAAIAGGTEAALTFGFLRAWDSMRVVSPTSCRPFSADRDGMTLGEGAAMLVLEPLDRAQARGAHIYAEVVGFGMSADAHHITQPQANGAALAMQRALDDVTTTLGAPSSSPFFGDRVGSADDPIARPEPGLSMSKDLGSETWAQRVGYINAHGTGTLTNDAVEAAAIHQVFGKAAPQIPVGATKSLTGHGIGTAGAIEALATVLALHRGSLPFTTGVSTVDPSLNLDVIINESRATDAKRDLALSNSLAFGGLNAVLAFRRYGASPRSRSAL